MVAAVGSVFVMPWHLFNSPEVIHYTLDTLGAAIGPLYGILVADYFVVKHEKLYVDDLYSDKPDGHYWYSKGFNPAAVKALIIGFFIGLLFVVIPQLFFLASFSWGIGASVGGYVYVHLMKRQSVAPGWTGGGRVKLQEPVPAQRPLSEQRPAETSGRNRRHDHDRRQLPPRHDRLRPQPARPAVAGRRLHGRPARAELRGRRREQHPAGGAGAEAFLSELTGTLTAFGVI